MSSERRVREALARTEEALEDAYARQEAGADNDGEIEELDFDLTEFYHQLEAIEQAKYS